jgi:cytoskeletal protein RodZ
MAKRDPEVEPTNEEPAEAVIPTVGERLRAAREEKGLSLEDVAAQTRIPQRHLASIEGGNWDSLPAPTYTVGFAKSYASAVGLDRNEVGNDLREEMGGQRFAATSADVFEPADPARTMPKSLVLGAIVAVIALVGLMSWLNNRSLDETSGAQAPASNPAPAPAATKPTSQPAPAPAPATAQGPVVLTASEPVWLQVSEKGGATLFSGMLQPGQTFAVPTTATAPVLKTGKPEALKATVGSTAAGPLGPPATTIANVSLLGADLLKVPAAQPAASAPAPAPTPRAQRLKAPTPAPATPAATPPTAETTPATNNVQ